LLKTAGFFPNEPFTISSRVFFEFGPLDRVIAVGHIGLVMLVVVEFQGFLRHMGREGVMGVRQIGKREGHGMMSAMMILGGETV